MDLTKVRSSIEEVIEGLKEIEQQEKEAAKKFYDGVIMLDQAQEMLVVLQDWHKESIDHKCEPLHIHLNKENVECMEKIIKNLRHIDYLCGQ